MFDIALLVFKDACFAAAAGLGFAYACMPPKKTLIFSALLAAVAHSCRFLLIQSQIFSIAAATLFASFLIGVLGMLCAKRLKVPAEIIAFPALLPMIPGIYAYKAVLALFSYIRAAGAEHKLRPPYLVFRQHPRHNLDLAGARHGRFNNAANFIRAVLDDHSRRKE